MAGPWRETDLGFCELTAAMRDLITAGDLLVQEGINVPRSLLLPTEPNSNGWAAVNGTRSAFEKTIHEEGWTLFFMAGEIKATVFGFDRQNALRAALKRLIAVVKSQHCNSIEITGVTDKSFLKVPYVSVSAHARHLQKGRLFSDSNPALPSLAHLNGG
jgi:hypothetical protein